MGMLRSRWGAGKAVGAGPLALVALFLLVSGVMAAPVSFQWRSLDPSGSTLYGVYDQDNVIPLQGRDLLQLVYAGPDGLVAPPDAAGRSTGDDRVLDSATILSDASLPPPLRGRGYFDELFSYEGDDWPDGTLVYVRAWNAPTAAQASHYGDSSMAALTASGLFTFGRWHTGTPRPEEGTFAVYMPLVTYR